MYKLKYMQMLIRQVEILIEDQHQDVVLLFGKNLVTWWSKKQNVIARNSAEAEFKSLAHGICEIKSIKMLLEDLKILVHFL